MRLVLAWALVLGFTACRAPAGPAIERVELHSIEAPRGPRILCVVAHPDDEIAFAATLYQTALALEGACDVAVITNGEGGFKYSTLSEPIYGLELTEEAVGPRPPAAHPQARAGRGLPHPGRARPVLTGPDRPPLHARRERGARGRTPRCGTSASSNARCARSCAPVATTSCSRSSPTKARTRTTRPRRSWPFASWKACRRTSARSRCARGRSDAPLQALEGFPITRVTGGDLRLRPHAAPGLPGTPRLPHRGQLGHRRAQVPGYDAAADERGRA